MQEFKNKREKGEGLEVTEYGRVYSSLVGEKSLDPNEVKDEIERKYGTSYK